MQTPIHMTNQIVIQSVKAPITPTLIKPTRPTEYNLIIGITSLWLLIPISSGLLKLFSREYPFWATTILTFWTLFSACVSSSMWKYYSVSSFLHKLDLICAKIEFIILLCFSLFYNHNVLNYFFPIGVVVMYVITNHYHNKHKWCKNFWSHLIFRYIGYWWCLISLCNTNKLWNFIVLSIAYYAHIIIKLHQVFHDRTFNIHNKYNASLAEMMLIIMIFGMINNVY